MLRVVGFNLKESEIADLKTRIDRLNKQQPCALNEIKRLVDLQHRGEEVVLLVARIPTVEEWLGWIPLWLEVLDQNRLRLVLVHSIDIEPVLKLAPRHSIRETHREPITEKALGFHVERQIDSYFQDAHWVLATKKVAHAFSESPQLTAIANRVQNRKPPEGQTWIEVFATVENRVRELKESLNSSRRNLTFKPEAQKISSFMQLSENLDASTREEILNEIISKNPELKDFLP